MNITAKLAKAAKYLTSIWKWPSKSNEALVDELAKDIAEDVTVCLMSYLKSNDITDMKKATAMIYMSRSISIAINRVLGQSARDAYIQAFIKHSAKHLGVRGINDLVQVAIKWLEVGDEPVVPGPDQPEPRPVDAPGAPTNEVVTQPA